MIRRKKYLSNHNPGGSFKPFKNGGGGGAGSKHTVASMEAEIAELLKPSAKSSIRSVPPEALAWLKKIPRMRYSATQKGQTTAVSNRISVVVASIMNNVFDIFFGSH